MINLIRFGYVGLDIIWTYGNQFTFLCCYIGLRINSSSLSSFFFFFDNLINSSYLK